MARDHSFLDFIDARPLVAGSRLRIGAVRARGLPAVLLGVASVVFAVKAGQALTAAAGTVPLALAELPKILAVARFRPLSGRSA